MQLTLTILFFVLTATCAYLIGSIPTAVIIASSHGVDITKVGSKNAGGTNVGRTIGKKAGILTMFLDALKCYLPCLIAFLLLSFAPLDMVVFPYRTEIAVSLVGLFVAIGHSYPIFSHFKGGKCVACFAGFVFFTSPMIFVLGAGTFFLVYFLKKRVSLASLIGAPVTLGLYFIPLALDLIYGKNFYNGGLYFAPYCNLHLSYVTTITVFLVVSLIVIRHRSNIKRLEKGTEPETHFKKD